MDQVFQKKRPLSHQIGGLNSVITPYDTTCNAATCIYKKMGSTWTLKIHSTVVDRTIYEIQKNHFLQLFFLLTLLRNNHIFWPFNVNAYTVTLQIADIDTPQSTKVDLYSF